jgi:hypothetical protein
MRVTSELLYECSFLSGKRGNVMSHLLRCGLATKVAVAGALLVSVMVTRYVIALDDCSGQTDSTHNCDSDRLCRLPTGCQDAIVASSVSFCTSDGAAKSDNCLYSTENQLCTTVTPCEKNALGTACNPGTAYQNPTPATYNGGQCNVPKPGG